MNENIIKFYLEANKLKHVVRTGWAEVGIPQDRIESVADHVYGCMALVIGLISEKEFEDIDLVKVYKMLVFKELIKVVTLEPSVIASNRKEPDVDIFGQLVDSLTEKEEYINLFKEIQAKETKESNFVLYVSKLESDLQAKIYELNGDFTMENALKDIEYYPEDIKREVKPNVKNPSDGWILFDRRYYKGDETFTSLSKDIQELKHI